MSEFWRACHARQDIEWLTGTNLDSYLRWYELEPPVGLDVTEIGIGLGMATRQLSERNRVTAVDIAPEALSGLPCSGLLLGALPDAPPADLAICHLVLQHCTLEDAARIMGVPLKPGGVFAFQFAYTNPFKSGDAFTSKFTRADVAAGRLFWHRPAEIYEPMHAAGLVPFWLKTVKHVWRGDEITWGLVKATRE